DVVHKGGRTYGYRVTCDAASFTYVPDALDANDDAILELAHGTDVFVRGTPFVRAEQTRADEYGHGTAEHAAEIAQRAGVGRFVITHHNPFRTDDAVEKVAASVGATALIEGAELDVGAPWNRGNRCPVTFVWGIDGRGRPRRLRRHPCRRSD